MCGIVGCVLGNREYSPDELRFIELRFKHAHLMARENGKDAAGIVNVTTGNVFYMKSKGPIEKVMVTENYKKVAKLGKDSIGLIGHTRFATLGFPEDNNNNHPLVVGRVIGVHNGVISNHHALRQNLQLHGQVDSEVIFGLLDSDKIDTGRVITAMKKLEGTFAVAFTTGSGKSIWLCRNYMSLNVVRDEMGVIWFSTRGEWITPLLDNYQIVSFLQYSGMRITKEGINEFKLSRPSPKTIGSSYNWQSKYLPGAVAIEEVQKYSGKRQDYWWDVSNSDGGIDWDKLHNVRHEKIDDKGIGT
ncbi:MAG: hypothetical protein HY376_03545 [Candidatus Blackburnbacteria bacterium]|nr:hypothetical protein [Candidatus Blackburnbacteria bacterium]